MRDEQVDAASVYALFASTLVNLPDGDVRATMARLLEAVGDEEAVEAYEGELEQRFYDRMVIGVSPLYLPAIESCILDAREGDDGRIEPGHVDGPRMTEVLACYRAYSFDHRALQGFRPLVDTLRADQLPAELAFMAHLRRLEALGDRKGEAAGRFADEFLARHLRSWVPVLCELAHQRGPVDVYVRLLDALRGWLDVDAERAG